jgi:hypothetical protein
MARHWVRTSLSETLWPLLLADDAQAVQIDRPDQARWEESARYGIRMVTPVCCGPAAPLPDRWA